MTFKAVHLYFVLIIHLKNVFGILIPKEKNSSTIHQFHQISFH